MKTSTFFQGLAVLCLIAVTAKAATGGQSVLTDADILDLANDKYATSELPLGDDHYTLDAPRTGYIYLCHTFGNGAGGAQHDGSWIHGATWNMREKLAVQGHVTWDMASFSITRTGDERELNGNGLPLGHSTGFFPIQPNDPAYAFDRNPNTIMPQTFHEMLPVDPAYTDPPYCMGMEVGYMLDGVPLFNGFDAGLRDAAAHEVQDSCQGHPQQHGVYHYHSLSSCIQDVGEKIVIGYALDGFPITGPVVAPGKYLTTENLDECHGLTSEIIEDGQKKTSYHYVMTVDFPYSVSCFRARPMRIGPAQQPGGHQTFHNANAPMPMQENETERPMMGPPSEALSACNGKGNGDTCGFISPRGDQISGICHAPPQSNLACIPNQRP